MAEHRVPMLSASLHRNPDPATSRDPRIRELVVQLATLDPAPAPRAHFRAELRAQLVAVAPRLIADGADEATTAPRRADAAPAARAAKTAKPAKTAPPARVRSSRFRLGRPLTLVTASVVVLFMLLGGAVWLSRSALPGDPLYGLKRASENLQEALTSGDVPRASEKLDQAATRYTEVGDLVPRASASGSGVQADGGLDSQTAGQITSTLNSADDDIRNAMQTLGDAAVHEKSATPLQVMIGWAPDQVSKLTSTVARIPAGSVHTRGETSLHLLSAALTRASTLQDEMGCGCLSSGRSDALGPLPCTSCSAPVTPGGGSPTSHGQTPGSAPGKKSQHSGHAPNSGKHSSDGGIGSAPPGGGPVVTHPRRHSGTSSTPPGLLPSPILPTLPNLPSLPSGPTGPSGPAPPPIGFNSCGLTVGLGGLGLDLGTCGVHLNG